MPSKLPVYPVSEDKKLKASDGKSVKQKNSINRTNIIATNLVWEQLKKRDL